MSAAANKTQRLVIGGVPRAELLPPELKAEEKARSQRRSLVALFIVVVAAVAAAYGMVAFLTQASQLQLDVANARTLELLAQQGEYSEGKQVADQIAAANLALQTATATEVDWRTFLTNVQAIAPEGMTFAKIAGNSANPIEPFPAPSEAFQGVRVGELKFSISAPSTAALDAWLEALKKVPGFVDASPSGIVSDGGGAYTSDITIHFNEGVLLNRFAPETPETPAAEETTNE